MRVSPSYLIGDGGFLLGPTAIASVRDLDDTSLHTYQQELGLRRSEITFDGKNLITKDVTSHILTVIKSLTKCFLDTKNGIVRPLCGLLVLRLRQRLSVPICGAPSRGGGIEQWSISQPRD